MSPEAYLGKRVDARADIFSVGIVLWQLATGSATPPYDVGGYADIQEYAQRVFELQSAGRIPLTNTVLDRIISRCVQPTPSARYGSFADVRRALNELGAELGFRPSPFPEETPPSLTDLLMMGVSMQSLGRYSEALACFDRALGFEDECAPAWSAKGECLGKMGKVQDALLCLDRALQCNPGCIVTMERKARILLAAGRHADARLWSLRVLMLDRTSIEGVLVTGHELHIGNDYELAIEMYR